MNELKEDTGVQATMEIVMSNIRVLNLLVENTPFDKLIKEINHTNTLMPLLDPTGYRGIMDQLPTIEKLAKKYQEIKEMLEEVRSNNPS